METDPSGLQTNVSYYDSESVDTVRTAVTAVGAAVPVPVSITVDDMADGVTSDLTVDAQGNIKSLSQTLYNDADQAVESARFTDVGTSVFNASTGQLTASGTYSREVKTYDAFGNVLTDEVDSMPISGSPIAGLPSGQSTLPTITATVYDGLERQVATLVGTDDSATSSNNMVTTTELQYDNNGVGDGNLTRTISFTAPNVFSTARVTDMAYDWRDRLVVSKSGVALASDGVTLATEDNKTNRPLTYYVYDNAGEVTDTYTYDGDQQPVASSAGAPIQPSATLMRAHVGTFYDTRGQVYRTIQYSVSQTNASTGSTVGLATNYWHDNRGDVIKTLNPGGLVDKATYDGAGRVVMETVGDGGAAMQAIGGGSGDAAPGAPDPTHSAASFSNNIILSETDNTYDKQGNVVLTVTRQRVHNASVVGTATSTGLSATNSIADFTENWYDAAGRLITSVDFGDNGSNTFAYNPAAAPPPRTYGTNGFDPLLRTDYSYDSAGNQASVTDPRGIIT
jgi:YD repeat-containing protein